MARGSAATQSEYELKRQEKIAANQALLRDLALDAASTGLAPSKKAATNGAPKFHRKKPVARKVKEEPVPLRTSSRLRGIVADSEVAKRKAEDERDAFAEAERAKRMRVSGDLNLDDILVKGQEWNASGNWLSNVGPAKPHERTFDLGKVKDHSDKELKALREKMGGLTLWEDFAPTEIKITPERIYSMCFHPTTDKPLVFAGDKLGNLGICDASPQQANIVKKEEQEDDDDEEGAESAAVPNVTTFKTHSRSITDMHWSPTDPNHLYTSSHDSSIRRLDLAKGVAIEVYAPADGIEELLSSLDISPSDPHVLYFSTIDGRFGRHDTRAKSDGAEVWQLCEKKIGGFSLHPQEPHIVATASLERTMKLWDLRKISGKGDNRSPALIGEHTSKLSISHAAFNAAGQVATSSYDDTVKIYDFSDAKTWKAGAELSEEAMAPKTIVPHNNQTGRWVTILRPEWQYAPEDGLQRFVIGNMNRFVDIYSASGQQIAQLGDPELVTAVPAVAQFHPTRDWVAAGTASGKLCLWM